MLASRSTSERCSDVSPLDSPIEGCGAPDATLQMVQMTRQSFHCWVKPSIPQLGTRLAISQLPLSRRTALLMFSFGSRRDSTDGRYGPAMLMIEALNECRAPPACSARAEGASQSSPKRLTTLILSCKPTGTSRSERKASSVLVMKPPKKQYRALRATARLASYRRKASARKRPSTQAPCSHD